MQNFVHHICIQTNDYHESLRFYKDALGFELIKESPDFHEREYNTWLRLGNFYIELQTGKNGQHLERPNPSTSSGVVHFCLWVEDLENEAKKLKDMGFKFFLKNCQEVYTVENGSLCKLLAPEGTIIELRSSLGI